MRAGQMALSAARRSALRLGRLLKGTGRPPAAASPPRESASGENAGGIDQPPQPLPCPSGAQTGPPDFVGVGMQRCGTTRWFKLLAAHPQVEPASAARPGYPSTTPKELHYFDRFYAGGCDEHELARYHEYFPRRDGQKVGEWTPIYASAPWVPPLLAAAAPRARLLVLLRDPLERFLSALALSGRVAERRGTQLNRYAPLDALWRGFYHAQLAALLGYFDRSQVLVLQYERCAEEPLAELHRTFEFLGVDDAGFVPAELEKVFRGQPEKPALSDAEREPYVRAYSEDVQRLVMAFPEIDLRLWPNFAHLADRSLQTG
jgi:hypothetical protein